MKQRRSHRTRFSFSLMWLLIAVVAAGFSFGLGAFISRASVTLSGTSITGDSAFNSFTVPGTPPASSSTSLLELGPNTIDGSPSGTFIGINPSSFSGDFLNFQVNSSTKFSVDSSGNVTASTIKFPNGTVQASAAGAAPSDGVLYAADFSGSDAGAKIQACLNALPTSYIGGTCDARGLPYNSTSAETITFPAGVKLLLPNGGITFSVAPAFNVTGGDKLIGFAPTSNSHYFGSKIVDTAVSGGNIVQITNPASNLIIKGILFYGDGSAGSVAVNLAGGTMNGQFSDFSTANVDVGIKIGGTAACDCYNSFNNVSPSGTSYGIEFLSNANQNQWYGGQATSSGVGMYIAGGNEEVFGMDSENTPIGLEISGGANGIYHPYFEANSTAAVQLDSSAVANTIIGASGVLDNSLADASLTAFPPSATNGTPNFFLGLQGASQMQMPKFFQVSGPVEFSGSHWNDAWFSLFPVAPGSASDPGSMRLGYGPYGGSNGAGAYGTYAPLYVGSLTEFGGDTDSGSSVRSAIANPSAPVVSVVGTPGTATVSYALVCEDFNGHYTMPSSFTQITNAPNTLNSTNYVHITWTATSFNGCKEVDVLKNDTATLLAHYSPGYGYANDQGGATSAFTAPVRNATGDMSVAGTMTEGCAGTQALTAGTATVTNACISGSRPIICTDNTATSSAACSAVRSSGSITIYGTGSDTVSWAQL